MFRLETTVIDHFFLFGKFCKIMLRSLYEGSVFNSNSGFFFCRISSMIGFITGVY